MLILRGLGLFVALALPFATIPGSSPSASAAEAHSRSAGPTVKAAQDARPESAASSAELRLELAAKIDDLLQAHHAIDQLSGAVLVADAGEVVYSGAVGMANSDWDVPNTPATKFRLASITKQFTAMAVLLLVDEGKLDLDASITTYLRDYPAASGDRVTLHHLLNHTSGIPSYTDRPGFMRNEAKERMSVAEFVREYCSDPLDFEPGTEFRYNNSGYFLLGAILEEVTGQTYAEVLEERIFAPLGMRDSGVDDQYRVIPGRAVGYDDILGGRRVALWLDMTTPGAAGAMYSTVGDLWKWDQALRAGTLLQGELATRMVTPGLGDYGYGWELEERPADTGGSLFGEASTEGTRTIEYHGGGMPGVSTLIWRVPAEERVIIVLGNTMQTSGSAIQYGITELLAGRAPGAVRPRGDFEVAGIVLKEGQDRALEALATWPQHVQDDYLLPDIAGLSRMLLDQGRDAEARQLTDFLLAGYPDAPIAWDASAYVHRMGGDLETAIAHYGRVVELDPEAGGIRDLIAELQADLEEQSLGQE